MSNRIKRISWERYFMRIAQAVAERSTCKRASVGAVVVKDKRIIATGYNGSPSGLPHCTAEGCIIYISHDPQGGREENCYRTIHAEINAIAQAAKSGVSIDGADLYVTHSPCYHCLKVIINSGIKNVYYQKSYKIDRLKELVKYAKVQLVPIKAFK